LTALLSLLVLVSAFQCIKPKAFVQSLTTAEAGSGIGLECALAYAASGAAGVAFADIDAAAIIKWAGKSQELAVHPHYQCLALHVDISEEASVWSMVENVKKKFGRIDYAVNSAGVSGQSFILR
jgi:NAD(P)-dependent dehydrogenase (short-subunit alcohol dehydrogenase family)